MTEEEKRQYALRLIELTSELSKMQMKSKKTIFAPKPKPEVKSDTQNKDIMKRGCTFGFATIAILIIGFVLVLGLISEFADFTASPWGLLIIPIILVAIIFIAKR